MMLAQKAMPGLDLSEYGDPIAALEHVLAYSSSRHSATA